MAKTLLLLRHAKSSWDDPALADHDRPLAARGRKAGKLIGEYLRRERIPISLVLCSSARRARETLDLVAPSGEIQIERDLYGASADELLERLRNVPDEVDAVLLIGHNPSIEELAVGLVGGTGELAGAPATGELAGTPATGELAGTPATNELAGRKFPTGALATLALTGPWSALEPGNAQLTAFVRPRDLR